MASYYKNKTKKGKCKIEMVPEELLNVIQGAMKERIKNNLDPIGKQYQNYPRFFRAISRHQQLRKDLTIADFKDDETAQFSVFNIYTFMVVAFLAVLLFGGLIYVMGLVNGVMHNVGVANEVNIGQPGYTNMTLASDETFGVVNDSIQALRMVAIVYILAEGITIVITGFLVKIHPLFFFAYVLIVSLGIILAAPIANAYYNLLGSGVFGGVLPSFTGANWLVLNLPYLVLVIGILGGIGLFINIVRGGGEGQIQ